jgi:hypothetical protein
MGYGKPFLFTFTGPGTFWARIEPETAPELRRPATKYSLNVTAGYTPFVPQCPIAPRFVIGLKRESKVLVASDTG